MKAIALQLAATWLIYSTASPAAAERGQLSVGWQVIANRGEQFDAELTLSNAGPGDLPATGWRIYFNSARLLTIDQPSAELALRHVNGDFFELCPTPQFQPLRSGESRTFDLQGAYWAIKETDAPSGFYLVNVDRQGQELGNPRTLPVRIAPFLTPLQTSRSRADNLSIPTAASRFDSNPPFVPEAPSARDTVVPTPLSTESLTACVQLDSSTMVVYSPGLDATASLLVEHLRQDVGVQVMLQQGARSGRNAIQLRITAGDDNGSSREGVGEGYTLKVNENGGIEIAAETPAGVYYGVQTLRALLPVDAYHNPSGSVSVGCVVIKDAPRFSYRGLHLDVARNFHPAEISARSKLSSRLPTPRC